MVQRTVEEIISESIDVKQKLLEHSDAIKEISEIISKCYLSGKKLIIFGNGGSAADAQHIAAELSGRFYKDRKGLPAIALTTNTSALTAISNDYDFESVFSRQLDGIVNPSDVVIGISTSGNSPNVIRALKKAKRLHAVTIGLCGQGGKLKKIADYSISVPSRDTARIQESHILIGHAICELVENKIFD